MNRHFPRACCSAAIVLVALFGTDHAYAQVDLPEIAYGQTLNARFDAISEYDASGIPFDVYLFEGEIGHRITARLASKAFSPAIAVYRVSDGSRIKTAHGQSEATVTAVLPDDDLYLLSVTSLGDKPKTGSYTLSLNAEMTDWVPMKREQAMREINQALKRLEGSVVRTVKMPGDYYSPASTHRWVMKHGTVDYDAGTKTYSWSYAAQSELYASEYHISGWNPKNIQKADIGPVEDSDTGYYRLRLSTPNANGRATHQVLNHYGPGRHLVTNENWTNDTVELFYDTRDPEMKKLLSIEFGILKAVEEGVW